MIPDLREFEICEGDGLVASGTIYSPSEPICSYSRDGVLPPTSPRKKKEREMQPSDIYKELRLRGYDYEGDFRGIFKAVNRGKKKCFLNYHLQMIEKRFVFDQIFWSNF